MNEKVSVIVPIYKVEKYLRECIDSIINQTYTNLEIILVDDGSPDNCGVICDEYALQDSRIRVIHLENSGVSAARNAGMEIMTGKYLMFVDSDDWIDSEAVEILYQTMMENNADLAVGGHIQFQDGTDRVLFTNCRGPIQITIISKVEEFKAMLQYGWCVWARLYRKELFQGLLFSKNTRHEDEAIMRPLMERCGKIVRINAPIYHYRNREGSIVNQAFSELHLSWYWEGKKHLDWVRMHIPELESVAKHRLFESIYLHLMEMTLVDKKYWKYAKPLVCDLRDNYGEMKQMFREKGKSTVRLTLMRWLPYPVFYYLMRAGRTILSRN